MDASCRAWPCIHKTMKKFLPFLIIVVVLIAAAGGAVWLFKRTNPGTQNSNSTFANLPNAGTAAPGANQTAQSSDGLKKPNVKVSSPVVLEEYGDYQCPPCGQLYPELKQIEQEYGNQVQIVFHHFPLTKIHKNALLAAHAAEAARNQNKFWEMHNRLYSNQKAWADLDDPRPTFISYAQQLGLNVDQFSRDLTSNQIDQRISADIQRGTSMGVTGTPTVFLDSHLVNYQSTNLDGLRRGINILLERKAGT